MRSLRRAGPALAALVLSWHASPARAQDAPPSKPPVVSSLFEVELYGGLYTTASWTDRGTNFNDIPQFAIEGGTNDEGSFGITAFQSRLGLSLRGPKVIGLATSGRVELDFFGGGRDSHALSADVRLRLYYASLSHKYFELRFGQDWMLFMPELAASITHVAIPQFSASGEVWMRIPQVRVSFGLLEDSDLILVGRLSVNRPLGQQFFAPGVPVAPAGPEFSPTAIGAAEAWKLPYFQGSAELGYKLADKRRISAIISGTFGVEDYKSRNINSNGFHEEINSYGAGASLVIDAHEMVSIKGEGYWGKNIDEFFGGVLQGVFIRDGHRKGVRTRGGWVQLQLRPVDFLQINVGAGVDDPNDSQFSRGVTTTGQRLRNQTTSLQVWLKKGPFTVGVEWNYIETELRQARDAYANQVAVGMVMAW